MRYKITLELDISDAINSDIDEIKQRLTSPLFFADHHVVPKCKVTKLKSCVLKVVKDCYFTGRFDGSTERYGDVLYLHVGDKLKAYQLFDGTTKVNLGYKPAFKVSNCLFKYVSEGMSYGHFVNRSSFELVEGDS